MNTKRSTTLAFVLALALPFCLGAAAAQDDIRQRAAAAQRSGDHETTIQLCLGGLRYHPSDYELAFLLSRAYAFSGRWGLSLRVLDDLALAHPENTDILLFRARVESWKHNYQAAEKGYNDVLRVNPGNSEAYVGLAEVASWQNRYGEALGLYERVRLREPNNADIYFRIGRVYQWDGKYDVARANFEQARRLDPQNEEYRRSLKTATPRVHDLWELRTEYQAENFSDGREAYIDRRLALQVRVRSVGPVLLRVTTTTRYGTKDNQYGFALYPRLWSKAYADIVMDYSPEARYLPRASYTAEIYQTVSRGWDISLGARRMNFGDMPVTILLGSVGTYLGRYLVYLRWYESPDGEGDVLSWTINLRRFFSDSNCVYAAYGRGSRPFDIITIEDYAVARSWVLLGGLDWVVLQRFRVQLNYTYRDEGRVRRNLLWASLGYRW